MHKLQNMLMLILPLWMAIPYAAIGCILPLAPGSWYSTTRGTWSISNRELKSYAKNFELRISVQKSALELECVKNIGTKYIFRTKVELYEEVTDVYICVDIHLAGSSSDVFLYYIATPPEERTWEPISLSEKDACSKSDYKAAANAHLLIKEGSETTSAISCPNVLHGKYNVEFEEKASAIKTGVEMDSCTDDRLMVFTNVDSNSYPGFTSGSILHCLYSVTSGSRVYLHTYNNDTSVDTMNTFKVACWVIEEIGDQIKATAYPGKFTDGQSSTAVQYGGQILTYSSQDASNTNGRHTLSGNKVEASLIFIAIMFLKHVN